MGIIDKIHALTPRRVESSLERGVGGHAVALRHDIDRWFQRVVEEPWSMATRGTERFAPAIDVRETPTQVVVTAEVPGLDPQEVDVSVSNGALIIRGEKRETTEETQGDVLVSEVRYGSFLRSIPLSRDVEVDRAEAQMQKGVLTVTLPKTSQPTGRIPVRT